MIKARNGKDDVQVPACVEEGGAEVTVHVDGSGRIAPVQADMAKDIDAGDADQVLVNEGGGAVPVKVKGGDVPEVVGGGGALQFVEGVDVAEDDNVNKL